MLDSTTLGRLATPSQTGICVLTGPSQVINTLVFFYPSLRLILFLGYDYIVQERIHYMLDTNDRFRAKFASLLANDDTKFEIEEEMSYHSLVAYPYIIFCMITERYV